jgi:cold shock CspA family protein
VQGVIKSYDPGTGDGVVVRDTDLADLDLAPGALEGSVLRMVRQGQRVVFDLDASGRATALRLGSEVDMGTPGFPREGVPREELAAPTDPLSNDPTTETAEPA